MSLVLPFISVLLNDFCLIFFYCKFHKEIHSSQARLVIVVTSTIICMVVAVVGIIVVVGAVGVVMGVLFWRRHTGTMCGRW